MASEDQSREEKLPRYIEYQGYRVAGGFPVDGIKSGIEYRAKDDDLFIVTYPKVSEL